ncbi:hypothetical protein IAR55_001738 [Kwoniella newhampshirensis]|uniref:Chromo domain-containing protein n=1 Tax=Kwoniella newhampshirensis TaxID=1651941 RepID=A0AAW0Z2Y2_9TREE
MRRVTRASSSVSTPSHTRFSSEAESSSSSQTSVSSRQSPRKRARTSGQPTPEKKRRKTRHSDVYVVSRILARSLEKGWSADGEDFEHQYLVRWEGYGPNDDTWEMRSGLMEGAAEVLNAFDEREHPFTILDSRGLKPTAFLVRYGVESSTVKPSPLYEKAWQTPAQMRSIGGLSAEAVKTAVRDFQQGTWSGRAASPRMVQLQKERCILAILERVDFKRKHTSANYTQDYRIRWRDRRVIKEEWLMYNEIVHLFDEDGKESLREWNENNGYSFKPVPITTDTPAVLSEYELERIRNIEANKELMKTLGL